MTDPERPDDDLVSAVLDGEATAAEQTRVDTDPVLAARLVEFRAVRDAVAGPVTHADPALRDEMITKALAAAHDPSPPSADVADISSARRRRDLRARRLMVVAAAVFAVLALAGGLLALDDDNGDTAATQAAGDAGSDAADAAESGEGAGGEIEDLALGQIDDAGTLARRVGEQTGLASPEDDDAAERPAPTAPAADADGRSAFDNGVAQNQADGDAPPRSAEDCTIGLVEDRPEFIGQLAQGTVTYQGVDAYVFVYSDTKRAAAVAVVVAMADCSVLAETPL